MTSQQASQTFQSKNVLVFVRIEPDSAGDFRCSLECPAFDFATLIEPMGVDLGELSEWASHYDHIDAFLVNSEETPSETQVRKRRDDEERLAYRLAQIIFVPEFRKALEFDFRHFARKKRRLVFVVSAALPQLDQIPWELLAHPSLVEMLGISSRLGVCRGSAVDSYQETSSSSTARLMLVSSAPLDKSSPNPDDEFERIQKLFIGHAAVDSSNISASPNLPYLSLVGLLEQKPTVLHIVTHGARGSLSFRYGDGAQRIPYGTLVEDISSIDSIQLVVLDACYSARPDAHGFCLARQLVERGIPAVIGMATQVTPRASTLFSHRLYLALSSGKSIIEAYDSAVDYLRIYREFDQILWSTPMLYQSRNVVPFASIARHGRLLHQPPELLRQSVNHALGTFEEFRLAFDDIEPRSYWTANDWRASIIAVTFLLHPLADRLRSLASLPDTNHPETLSWLLQFKDARKELEGRFVRFRQCHEALMLDTLDKNLQQLGTQYMWSGTRLVDQIEIVSQLLERY